jgi:hypothetical protein
MINSFPIFWIGNDSPLFYNVIFPPRGPGSCNISRYSILLFPLSLYQPPLFPPSHFLILSLILSASMFRFQPLAPLLDRRRSRRRQTLLLAPPAPLHQSPPTPPPLQRWGAAGARRSRSPRTKGRRRGLKPHRPDDIGSVRPRSQPPLTTSPPPSRRIAR